MRVVSRHELLLDPPILQVRIMILIAGSKVFSLRRSLSQDLLKAVSLPVRSLAMRPDRALIYDSQEFIVKPICRRSFRRQHLLGLSASTHLMSDIAEVVSQ